jgi:flagellar basal body-associated protein FliL
MGYQPNLEREEYSPPDKKRVTIVVVLAAVAVLAVGLIVYGLFMLAKGMSVPPVQIR